MTGTYTFKTLYNQIKTQKRDFWLSSIYGIIATLLLLPIPMLIPLLIDEVLLLWRVVLIFTGVPEDMLQ